MGWVHTGRLSEFRERRGGEARERERERIGCPHVIFHGVRVACYSELPPTRLRVSMRVCLGALLLCVTRVQLPGSPPFTSVGKWGPTHTGAGKFPFLRSPAQRFVAVAALVLG